MKIFAADDPLVLDGTYDTEGYKPGERARIEKARLRQQQEEALMAKRGRRMDQKLTKPTKGKTKVNGRQPRQRALGGMEDVRISALDDLAASIAETREQMNTLRGEESDHLRAALKLMRKHNRTTWRAAGVELARVPGEEKLRVRTTKQAATAETDPEGGEGEGDDDDDEHVEVVDGPGEEIRPGVQAEH